MTRRPLIADLFCGAGGAGMGLHRAGFDVVGFDIKKQPRYPFDFVQQDALTVDLPSFDAVWASPPCQAYTRLKARSQREHPQLIEATRFALVCSGLPYIMENVAGSPLNSPGVLCGSMFPQLLIRRHRLFESDIEMHFPDCNHNIRKPQFDVYEHYHWRKSRFVPVYGNGDKTKASHVWNQAMGIDWMTRKELTQAVPPAYSEYLGRQLIEALATPTDAQEAGR